jgi:hypothetical protein
MPRRLLLFVSFVCFVVPLVRAADVGFVLVWPGWRDAEAFDRISEYFGGGENPGGQIILRTQPRERAGYYFLARVKSEAAQAGVKFLVSVIRPDSPDPRVFTFPATLPAKETIFQLGLTGADWPGGQKANPAAWKISLVDAGGQVLAEYKSFLWEKPAK